MHQQTALHKIQSELSATFVEISGIMIPGHYGSHATEHAAVRESAGVFDISNHCVINVQGGNAERWLRTLLSNDVAKISDGQGLYTCLCRENAGVIDHFFICRISEHRYRLLIDRSRLQKDLDWLEQHNNEGIDIDVGSENATLSIQGPEAVHLAQISMRAMGLSLDLDSLSPCHAIESGNWLIMRSGDSGEDGLQVNLPANQAAELWQSLAAHDVVPAGMHAYNTLRLEAGFAAYGRDIDEQHSPVEAGLGATIDLDDDGREFIGKEILEDHKLFGGRVHQIGLILGNQSDLSEGLSVERVGRSIGQVTSAGFSPTRGSCVALARVDKVFKGGCDINQQGLLLPAQIASVPFVPHGHSRE